ncbi:DMT family transporter [Anaerospora sp.]|uniref:DMT family transporter n=1 Tax=Anaerospora sp. TaxID=1960278 RepID=UPI0028A0B205|nr:DMT family transporter [Anaerospora sp.]MDF2929222.1 eamA 2 [Anaerospora sp.]
MYLAYGVMCLIFGTTFLAIKVGVDAGIPPFFFGGTRFLAAGIAVGLFMYCRKKPVRLPRTQVIDALYVGVMMTTALFAALYWGEQYISSGLAALFAAATPALIALIQWYKKENELAAVQKAGLVIGFTGVALAIFPSVVVADNAWAVWAIIAILAGELCAAMGAVRSKQALQKTSDVFLFNAYQMVFGGVGLLLLSLIFESPGAVQINETVMYAWLHLTVLGSMVGHGIYYWLVKKSGPVFSSTWTYVSPIIAQGVGYWWLNEPITVLSALGLLLVLAGVQLQNTQIAHRLSAYIRNAGESGSRP